MKRSKITLSGVFIAIVSVLTFDYSQKRIEILDNRLEKEIDDYLIYIVSENADEIYDEIIKNM